MRYLTFLFLLFSLVSVSQELKMNKATMQTVNHGASPSSTTTYLVLLEKNKKFKWQIDSVVAISGHEVVKYNIVKVDDPDSSSPKYEQVKSYNKCDIGKYLITFSITKNRGGGRPGSPQNQKADTTNIEGGVIIYYRVKGKTKMIKVDVFEKLDTINAP